MIELVDNKTGKTIGNALCYFVKGEDGKPGNGSKPSSLFSGAGGKGGNGTAGSKGFSGSGAVGGVGGSETATYQGSGGTLLDNSNTSTAGVYIYKYVVTGIQ